jgi:hypothetical protein
MKMIQPVQVKIIHTAIFALGLSDDTYRDILWTQFSVRSCTALSYKQASDLLDQFKARGFRFRRSRSNRTRKSAPHNVTFLPSSDQMQLINDLAAQVAWKYADGFQRWLAKYIKTDKIRTSAQAQRAIEGLKNLLKHQQEKENEK